MLLTISVLQRLACKQDITVGLGDIQNTVYNNTYFDSIEQKYPFAGMQQSLEIWGGR